MMKLNNDRVVAVYRSLPCPIERSGVVPAFFMSNFGSIFA